MAFKNRYLFRLLLSLAGILILSHISYKVISKSMYRQYQVYEKFDEIFLGKGKYDVLFMGSSRTKNHINPAIIDSCFGVNTLNIGTAGANIIECRALLQSYLLTHVPPRSIVLTVDLFSLNTGYNLAFYPLYIPYRNIGPIRENLQREGVHVFLYDVFPFLSLVELDDYYRGATIKVAMHHKEFQNGDFYYKGFESNTGDTVKPEEAKGNLTRYEVPVTVKGKYILNEFIHLCKQNHIRLIFSYAPEYKQLSKLRVSNFAATMSFFDSIARSNNIPFLRHDLLPICQDHTLFANPGHLNRYGAQVYSRIMARALDSVGVLHN